MERRDIPAPQYVDAEHVLDAMGREGDSRIRSLGALQIVVLGIVAGGFITMGALFSVLLGAGVEAPGPQRLLEGLGFSAGFFFVILSAAALFTEANVTLPATLVQQDPIFRPALTAGFAHERPRPRASLRANTLPASAAG